jgi:osmotically-inducible protein OsmY
MKRSEKHRYNRIVRAGITASLLALGGICVAGTSSAQDSMTSHGDHGADAQVAARVKQALHSDQTLDSRHINVAVEHGDVVLKGFAQDARAVETATQVATKAAGNHKIVNRVEIKQEYPNAP